VSSHCTMRSFVLSALHFGLFEFCGERNQCRDGTDVQIKKQCHCGPCDKGDSGGVYGLRSMSHLSVVVAVVNGEWTFVSVDGGSWLRWFSSSKMERERGEQENVACIYVGVW
jgi:hypothetical protein